MQCTLQAQVECYFILRSHQFFSMVLKKQVRETVPLSAKIRSWNNRFEIHVSIKGAKMLSDHAERRQHSFKISRLTASLTWIIFRVVTQDSVMTSKGQESRPLYLQTTDCGQLSFYDKWLIQFYLVNSGQPLYLWKASVIWRVHY